MNGLQFSRLSAQNVLYVVINEHGPFGVEMVAIQQDAIDIRKGLSGFFSPGYYDPFKPEQELEVLYRPRKCFRVPGCELE